MVLFNFNRLVVSADNPQVLIWPEGLDYFDGEIPVFGAKFHFAEVSASAIGTHIIYCLVEC